MLQSEAMAILNAGANVFLTGAPGAGKTHVLNEFIRNGHRLHAYQRPDHPLMERHRRGHRAD